MSHSDVPDDAINPMQRLELARDDLAERDAVKYRLDLAGGKLRRAEAVRQALADTLAREQLDVDRLKGLSAARVWSGLRGSRAEDLERESAEAAEAEAAYERAGKHVEALKTELAGLTQQAAQLANADRAYERALEAVATAGPTPWADTAGPATDAVHELARLRETRDIDLATAAARSALQRLVAAQEVLRSANAWSTFDTFGGGGLVSSAIKHKRLDEARPLLQEAADGVRHLATLLDGVSLKAMAMPEFTSLTRNADVWFDNIFSDVTVFQQIHRCRDDVADAIAAVERAMTVLKKRRTELADDGTQRRGGG